MDSKLDNPNLQNFLTDSSNSGSAESLDTNSLPDSPRLEEFRSEQTSDPTLKTWWKWSPLKKGGLLTDSRGLLGHKDIVGGYKVQQLCLPVSKRFPAFQLAHGTSHFTRSCETCQKKRRVTFCDRVSIDPDSDTIFDSADNPISVLDKLYSVFDNSNSAFASPDWNDNPASDTNPNFVLGSPDSNNSVLDHPDSDDSKLDYTNPNDSLVDSNNLVSVESPVHDSLPSFRISPAHLSTEISIHRSLPDTPRLEKFQPEQAFDSTLKTCRKWSVLRDLLSGGVACLLVLMVFFVMKMVAIEFNKSDCFFPVNMPSHVLPEASTSEYLVDVRSRKIRWHAVKPREYYSRVKELSCNHFFASFLLQIHFARSLFMWQVF